LKATLTLEADIGDAALACSLGELVAADDNVSAQLGKVDLVEVGRGPEAEHSLSGVAVAEALDALRGRDHQEGITGEAQDLALFGVFSSHGGSWLMTA
jgi:hypothetical protein